MNIGIDMSKGAIQKRLEEAYEASKFNPENMSYWFPKIDVSLTKVRSILKVPETKIIKLDFESWKWLRSDNYTEEAISSFNSYLVGMLDDFLEGETLFLKTGIFSNKFHFKDTMVESENNIGNQFLDMYYASMCLGADQTNEVVFRRFILDKENRSTIYKGMPLRTEFRVFYDFDTKKAVGVANYWHPEVMESHLDSDDQLAYQKEKDKITAEYNSLKEKIIKEVELYMDGCEGLKGKWSVDIMKNGDVFWIIDMARMERSALVQQMEVL